MKVLFIVIGIIILITSIIALRVFFGLGHPGNAAPYALRRQLPRDNSPLRGKTILCLGSSISSGFSSGGVSFPRLSRAHRRLPYHTGDRFRHDIGRPRALFLPQAAAPPHGPHAAGARLLPVSAFHQ